MHNRVLLRSLFVWMLLSVVASAMPGAPTAVQAADPPAPASATITLTESGFSPAEVTIAAGGEVTWVNATTTTYTLQSASSDPAPNGQGVYLPLVAMNAGAAAMVAVQGATSAQETLFGDQLAPNASYKFQFTQRGEYEYFLVENPQLKGKVVVAEAPQSDPAKINFQPAGAPAPADYTPDTGAAFDEARGYGWVREDSLQSATRVALDVSARAADRNRPGIDQRNDTVIAMQPAGGPNAAWERVVLNGTYSVTVSVGDGPPYSGSHTINVEGTRAITGFISSAAGEYSVATVVVAVLDGRLTIDALGGQNTVINYVEILPAGPVVRPSVSATEPTDGTAGVPYIGTTIQVTVDLPLGVGLNPATVSAATVSLKRGAATVPISVSLAAPNLILVRPTTAISPSTAYVLQLGDQIANTSGVKLVPYTLNFTTAADPNQPGTVAVSPPVLTLYRVEGTPTPTSRTVTISNTGAGPLRISAINIGGTNANKFGLNRPTLPITLTPNTSLNVTVVFSVTGSTAADKYGPRRAELRIVSNADPEVPTTTVRLNGLGVQSGREPSLQWILDTLDIPVNVGDAEPTNADMPGGGLLGEEVSLQKFQRADTSKPITLEPLAIFGPTNVDPITRFGIYRDGAPTSNRQEAFSIAASTGKTLLPVVSGTLSLVPTPQIGATFGLYSIWPNFNNRAVYSEDALNDFDAQNNHKVRVYPYKEFDGTAEGSPVANAYVVAFEECNLASPCPTNAYDFQDLVFIIRNVRPVTVDPCVGCNLEVRNEDNVIAGGMLRDDLLTFHTAVGRDPQRQITVDGQLVPAKAFVHEVVTLTLRNTGTGPLRITGLPIGTRWEIQGRPTLPLTIAPGGEVPLRIRFKSQGGCPLTGGCQTGYVYRGTLAIQSNDPDDSSKAIDLRGYWQPAVEKSEPSLAQIIDIFGFKGNIPDTAKNFRAMVTFTDDGKTGGYKAVGDEVLSPNWQRADPSQPMRVLSLGTFHGCCVDQIRFRIREGSTFSPQIQQLRDDAQTILPRNVGQTGFVQGSYTPAGPFVVFVDGYGSNRGVNNQTHALRFFPLRDDNGNVLPNTYVVGQDILGSFNSGPPTNYDYQDSAWLVTNIQPTGGAVVQGTPFDRINVGGSGFANPSGGVAWRGDGGLFLPGNTPSEPGPNSYAIEGTDIPQLYRSYRGQVGTGNTFTINIPVAAQNLNANSEIGLRLHFAELFWGRPGSPAPCSGTDCRGRRVFDVSAEGQLIVDDLDIFGLSSGALRANVIPIDRVRVTDGTLTLTFVASVDNPSISGIELLKLP
jgi:plastocyanin